MNLALALSTKSQHAPGTVWAVPSEKPNDPTPPSTEPLVVSVQAPTSIPVTDIRGTVPAPCGGKGRATRDRLMIAGATAAAIIAPGLIFGAGVWVGTELDTGHGHVQSRFDERVDGGMPAVGDAPLVCGDDARSDEHAGA